MVRVLFFSQKTRFFMRGQSTLMCAILEIMGDSFNEIMADNFLELKVGSINKLMANSFLNLITGGFESFDLLYQYIYIFCLIQI